MPDISPRISHDLCPPREAEWAKTQAADTAPKAMDIARWTTGQLLNISLQFESFFAQFDA